MPTVADSKTYLGDGVYADYSEGVLTLTTEDGISTTNTIYLEPAVYQALVNYYARVTEPITVARKFF